MAVYAATLCFSRSLSVNANVKCIISATKNGQNDRILFHCMATARVGAWHIINSPIAQYALAAIVIKNSLLMVALRLSRYTLTPSEMEIALAHRESKA